jgi:hypothetical protein
MENGNKWSEKLQKQFPNIVIPNITLPQAIDKHSEVVVVVNGDGRRANNQTFDRVQQELENKLKKILEQKYGIRAIRSHEYKIAHGHGFIESQWEGANTFMGIDPNAPLIVLLTSWQYSHHIAPSLVHHSGPILILTNFDGTWPGLVGALSLCGTLTSLGKSYSRLWSENFDDEFFFSRLEEWIKTGKIKHDTSYLKQVTSGSELFKTEAGKFGKYVGQYVLHHKEVMGLFDIMCMGMVQGLFPMKSLYDIGLPMEGLSQSMLVHEMSKVPRQLREECLQFYIDRGMNFKFGSESATELTREQVLEQCAMLIAMARVAEHYHLSSIGVQYQLGLNDICAASDFAEGAIGSTQRFPIPNENGRIIRPGKPITCVNEVDMGSGIPQTMLFRLLDTLGLPSETTLHDVRWGSKYKGVFYWDFEISGAVPFEHIKGGIAGAVGYRQIPAAFSMGGSTIGGQCKAGAFIWARAHYEGTDVYMHIGTGKAYELPSEEFQRRLQATTKEWPLMNVTLDGVSRDDLMAGHQSNHITVAYVPEEHLKFVTQAFVCMAITQGIKVSLAGKPIIE